MASALDLIADSTAFESDVLSDCVHDEDSRPFRCLPRGSVYRVMLTEAAIKRAENPFVGLRVGALKKYCQDFWSC